jgi:hypothetical protein
MSWHEGAGTTKCTYDLGACWEHEIIPEQTLARPWPGLPGLRGIQGDSPAEYWSEEDPRL